MLDSHQFIVRIDEKAYTLAEGFSFTRDLKLATSSFEIRLIDPDLSLIKAFRPGVDCSIEIDGRVLVRGFLDALALDDTNGHVYTYTGRDRAGDLIDCSAVFSNGGFERTNIGLEAAVKDVLKPFNMPLTVSGDPGKPFPRLSITPGDTVFQFIEQTCKYRALFPLSDGVGGLILTGVSDIKSPGALVVGPGGNVKSRQATIDHRDRFSSVTVKGQADGAEFGEAEAETLSGGEGKASDPDIRRHRPLILQAEREGYDLDLRGRAEWEVRHRRFAGVEIIYTVPGWEAAPGEFWTINTLVPVRDPQLQIARDMLIRSVALTRDESGTQAQIGVAPAEAYDLPAMRQEQDDAIWGGEA